MLEDYFFTKKTKWVLWGIFIFIIALLIFHAGVVVGSHQSARGRLELRGPGMFGGFIPQSYVESSHGAVGIIEELALPIISIKTRGGGVQKVYVSTSTVVTGGATSDASALQIGQMIVGIGDPDDVDNEGYLEARIVHILPPSTPTQASSSTVL